MQERARELAVAESLDNGKPIKESRDVDVPLVAAWFFYYAGWADKLDHAGLGANPQALGVAAQVIPWNFPLLMLAWKIAPALAAGNTVVLKPAETTSLTALLFAEIVQQAELPNGVVNIVTGAGETGAALVRHPDVNKVAFTGSTAVGREIAKAVAGTGKKVTLELGGKAANIVFDDAPIDQAIEGIVNGIFFNQGHVCCAGSRLLVQESVHEEVVDRLKHAARDAAARRPARQEHRHRGDQLARAARPHPRAQRHRRGRGRRALDRADCVIPENGFWFAPTIFDNVSTSSRIAREEIFGPVLSVLTFRTPAEAIAKANNTPYGLSAGIWSDKGSKILAVADKLRAGVIWANTFNRFDPASPFGGYKESGYGREGGRQGLAAYLERPATSPRQVGRPSRRRREMSSPRRPQDLQALHRRRLPAQRERPHLRGRHREGRLPRERRAGQPQGRAGCRARRPRGPVRLGERDGLQPRPGAVPHRRAARGPSRAVRRRDRSPPRGSRRPPRQAGRRRDRHLGLVRGLGRQVRAGRRIGQPGRRALLQPLGARADRAWSRSWLRRAGHAEPVSLLGLVSVLAPALVSGNTVVVVADEAHR